MTTSRSVLLALACAVVAGCGGGGGIPVPRTAPVSGVVQYKGKPAGGVMVKFHPKFDMGTYKFTPFGVTNKEGRFTLNTGAANDGAPPGDYTVTFELMVATADKAGRDTEVDAWKGRYGDPAAGKPVTIQSGENQLEPFKLD